jgi:hypothetical protein
MIDSIDTIVAASTGAVLLAVLCSMPQRLIWKLATAALFGAWVGFAIAVAAAGKLSSTPILGALVAFPLVTSAVLAAASPAVRSAMLSVPVPVVIGINVFRILGAQFLILASVGRLGGPFPLSAGWGDVLVGALAIPVAVLAMRVQASDPRIIAWALLGTLDLVAALVLGVVSGNGSPLQLIHAGAGSAAMQTLPWSLVPTVLVPLFLVSHAIVFAHAREAWLKASSRTAKPGLATS